MNRTDPTVTSVSPISWTSTLVLIAVSLFSSVSLTSFIVAPMLPEKQEFTQLPR